MILEFRSTNKQHKNFDRNYSLKCLLDESMDLLDRPLLTSLDENTSLGGIVIGAFNSGDLAAAVAASAPCSICKSRVSFRQRSVILWGRSDALYENLKIGNRGMMKLRRHRGAPPAARPPPRCSRSCSLWQ